MEDKFWMFLAFCGAVVITIVCIINYDGTQEKKEFGAYTYYVPDFRYDTTSSKQLYDRLLNKRSITCPVTSLSRTGGNPIELGSVCGSRHPYGISNFFVNWDDLGVKQVVLRKNSWWRGLGFSDESVLSGSNSVTFSTLFSGQNIFDGSDEACTANGYHVVEIIAPFSFSYCNVNTNADNGTDIIITNTGGTAKQKCRITFGGVVNWFCAGTPGQTMEVKNGSGRGDVNWEEHGGYHQTIIGNTKNAEVNGGSAGTVLGYAGPKTEITIEIYDGSWKTISIKDWIQATK